MGSDSEYEKERQRRLDAEALEIKKQEPHIVITAENDVIWRGYPSTAWRSFLRKEQGYPTQLDRKLGCVFIHNTCGGFVDLRTTSFTHKAFTCRVCGLRVAIPKEVETYGDLLKHFERFNTLPA